MSFDVRAPRPEDAEAVARVCRAQEAAFGGVAETTAEDLLDGWARLDLARDAWVVQAGDAVVGYASRQWRRDGAVAGDGYVAPAFRGRGIGSLLVELTESGLAPGTLVRNGVGDGDEAAAELLLGRGYAAVRRFYRMVVYLDGPPAPAEWPAGVEGGDLAPGEEAAAVEVTNAAFSGHYAFDGVDREWVTGAEPGLLLVAREDGAVRGVAKCRRERYGMGWVHSLAVDPAARRRGIGLALLRLSFERLYGLGLRRIGLGVEASIAATRLYERAGMRVLWSATMYEKTMR